MKQIEIFKSVQKYFLIIIIAGLTSVITVASISGSKSDSDKDIQFKTSNSEYVDTALVMNGRTLLDQFSVAFEASAAKISPSIVPIFAEQTKTFNNPFGSPEDPFHKFFGDDFFKRFFGNPSQKQTIRSLGSGVIVTEDGYILTNNHVVDGADKLTVMLNDKKKYNAEVIGTDPQSDVAVIKIDEDNLPAAVLGNSDNVKIGQWVIAVGNPFQLMHTITAGIISAKGRSSVGLATYEDFMQTDAAINPGNSGGALADLDGRVVGINTAISSPSGGNVGIGFAIPINMAKHVMESLIKNGTVSRGYLAVVPQDITEDLAKALKLDETSGALIGDVVKDGPADKAGMKRGDIILTFNGKKVEDSTQLRNMVSETDPGTKVPVTVLRDGDKIDMDITLGERPNNTAGNTENNPGAITSSDQLGLTVKNMTPDEIKKTGYEGVIITNVESGSAAENAGLKEGDIIREVNRKMIKSTDDFDNIISKVDKGDTIALLVARGEFTFYVAIQL